MRLTLLTVWLVLVVLVLIGKDRWMAPELVLGVYILILAGFAAGVFLLAIFGPRAFWPREEEK